MQHIASTRVLYTLACSGLGPRVRAIFRLSLCLLMARPVHLKIYCEFYVILAVMAIHPAASELQEAYVTKGAATIPNHVCGSRNQVESLAESTGIRNQNF